MLGVCVGAALAGQRPIGEMQFNDFVATGFNQLVNNAAKIRYRWGGSRCRWCCGCRGAACATPGPYHSQNTEAWFYRTPGLKIVAPSTPHDARALMAAAVADPDPVLYYEHIALYRDPRIKQMLDELASRRFRSAQAALRRAGDDLVDHLVRRVRPRLPARRRAACRRWHRGQRARPAIARAARSRRRPRAASHHCSRVLIVHEDTRTGSIGESLAAIIQEEAFESLDAPIRILGALDTPVPYSPPLEDLFLPSEAEIERAARLLVAY